MGQTIFPNGVKAQVGEGVIVGVGVREGVRVNVGEGTGVAVSVRVAVSVGERTVVVAVAGTRLCPEPVDIVPEG
jgi:uncharacterized alkaline shock family protein YloU